MRNEAVKKAILPILGLSLVLGSSLVLATKSKEAEQVSGYSVSSLPTTIDLNDTSAENIRSYYSSLNNLSESERKGTNLLKNLKTILKNGQKYYAYDSSGDNIWKMYEITDRDWDKSPASSISGYNSSTNKITGYSYNSTDPYVHALYINRDVTNQTKAWANHNQDQWGINREHVWPKAEGFESSGAGGARGDPMHLMAGNGYANNIHSNYFYGYVKTSSSYTDCGSKYSNQSGNLRGTPVNANSGTVFEPQDCDKGDIARAIFYMVARYNYLSGSDSDGIDSNNPNLELTQDVTVWASSGYSSTTSKTGKMGLLTDLLNWHHQDPVDEYEIHRNNLLYTNYTNNRNPFIDFPEWVDFIWGTATYSGKTKESYSSTPTGHATPTSDTINGYNSGSSDPVSVTGVSLTKDSTSIEVGASEVLSHTIIPSNATNQAVTWTSSNTSVATVSSSGRVEGVAEGSATITIRTSDGGFTDTCTVSVTAGSESGSSSYVLNTSTTETPIASTNSYDNYGEGTTDYQWAVTCGAKQSDGLWLGSNNNQKAKMILSNGSYSDASGIATAIGVATSATYYSAIVQRASTIANVDTVTLTYTGTGGTAPSEAWVLYNNGTNGWQVFQKVTSLSTTGTNFTHEMVASARYAFVIHSTGYCQFKVPILDFHSSAQTKTLSSISLDYSDAQTEFTVGDTFSSEGLVVTATYSDGSTDFVTPTSISSPNMSVAGSKTITVSYTKDGVTKSSSYSITVSEPVKTLTGITLDTTNVTTSYDVGETFNYTGLNVIAHYSDSTTDYVTPTSVSTPDMSTAGTKTVTVTYNGQSATYNITVNENEYSSATVVVADYASANSWVNGTKYTSITVVEKIITASVGVGGSSTGKYYTSGNEWRFYQSENATIVISASEGYVLKTVTLTYNISNSGVLKQDSTVVTSGEAFTVDDSSITFSVGNSGAVTNGQVKFTQISVTYDAENVSKPILTWNAPSINVYSGSTLTSDSTSTWSITYNDGDGHITNPTYPQFSIKLGGNTISLPYTWQPGDDGKTLCVSFNSLTTETTTVSIVQSLNSINKEELGSWSHTITAKTWSAYDAQTINGKSWTAAVPNNDGDNFYYDATKGQQFGKAADPCTVLTLSSSGFSGTVETIKVTTSGASSVTASLSVTVGGSDFTCNGNKTVSISATSTEYTFTGNSSGEIVITWTNTSAKALYLKGLVVSPVLSVQDIANVTGHEDAQRVAVKFAKAFNAAMDTTSNCTTNMSSAWSTCSSAYTTFLTEAAALGSTEETYAKNLIKYATAQYSDDSGEACIERMLKTYEVCVNKHGQQDFMSDLVTLGTTDVSPLVNIVGDNKATIIIVIVSLISASTIAGYFFIKRRKPE